MPGVIDNPNLPSMLAAMAQRIRALETQQQLVIGSANGSPLLQLGALINSSGVQSYGLQVFNPSTHTQVAFSGEDNSGDTYLCFYDDAGNPRCRLGLLPNGDYGLITYSRANDGTYNEINPIQVDVVQSTLSTSSTTYVNLSGPSVTATIGATGNALVRCSCFIVPQVANLTGYVGVSIDGGTPSFDWLGVGVTGTSVFIADNACTERLATGLSAGSHTFELYYRTSAASTCDFSGSSLTVQPI
jgi:hypothetical protein